MNNEDLVKIGYNKISQKYHDTRNKFNRKDELNYFVSLLPKKSKVLDVGCGSGVPIAKFLVKNGFGVTGIDLSLSMIKLARKNVPSAKFFKKNMLDLDFKPKTFDGITAFYSIIHVPKEKHHLVFKKLYKILKQNGIILVCMGAKAWEGYDDFHGEKMFWSHYGPRKSLKIIKDSGFTVLFNKIIEDGNEKHYWIIAKKN